jgi:hypothetical protein
MEPSSDQLRQQPLPGEQSFAAPVVSWVVIQLLALALSSARISLWPRPTLAVEDYALDIMLAAQVAGSALLFPWLMRNIRLATFVVLITLPFLQLAAILASAPTLVVFKTIALLWPWLISLALWRVVLVSERLQLIGVAAATSCSLGGAAMLYLRAEFSSQPWFDPRRAIEFGLAALFISAVISMFIAHRVGATGYPPRVHVSSSPKRG